MRIETAEAATPAIGAWTVRWFEPWFAAFTAGMTAGRTDPVLDQAPEVLASLSRPARAYRELVMVALDDDERVAGAARLRLPQQDNVHLVEVEIAVPPQARRRRVGTALLRAVRDLARDERRTSLLTSLDRPAEPDRSQWPGTAFAAAVGLTRRLTSVRRDLPLPPDAQRLKHLEADALVRADGYRIETWRGRTPEAYLRRLAGLMARMSVDAPMGELDYEPEVWGAARVSDFDDRHLALGRSWWTAVAAAPDGGWAGYTNLGWTPHEPDRIYQWDTLVLREHRGHRLGLLLKIAALQEALAHAPEATRVTTWNAETNAPMIAVNEAIGYRPVEVSEEWQADLDELRLP